MPQLFVDQSTAGETGNFGIGFYKLSSSFYTIKGYSYSGGVTYSSLSGVTSSDLPQDGDSVIFRYTSGDNTIRIYVNGSQITSCAGSAFPASAGTNRKIQLR